MILKKVKICSLSIIVLFMLVGCVVCEKKENEDKEELKNYASEIEYDLSGVTPPKQTEKVLRHVIVQHGVDGTYYVKDSEEPKRPEYLKSEEDILKKKGELNNDEKKVKKKFVYEDIEGSGASLYAEALELLTQSPPEEQTAYNLLAQAADVGHWKAKRQVGWGHVFGKNLPLDLYKASSFFTELADKGDPEGQMGLGFLYGAGLSHNSSQAKALVYFTFGALGDNEWAQMAMAYRYWAGIGVNSNCETALTYYRLVAQKVSEQASVSGGRAIQRVRLLEEVDNPNSGAMLGDDLIQYYQFLAEKGDVQAQLGMGQLHYQGGRGVQQDHQRAHNYFVQATKSGNPNAMAFLGKMYLEGGGGLEVNNETAYKYFKKAAEQNNALGFSGLGLMYLHGRYVKQDYATALKYFTQAAKQGWVDGQLQLGNMYFSGLGVTKDFKKAIDYYTLASQSGHVLAFYSLAQMQSSGTGMIRSCHQSVELFKNVAERGSWGELLSVAHQAYWNGEHSRALVLYMLLAELGYEVAQSNAAYILDRHGPFFDLFPEEETHSRALMYWGRAAGQGYSEARVKLGDHHYYGWGTSVDFEAAAAHYRVASEQQRNAQAMFNLGYMHEHGQGLNKDMHLAKRFYDLARESDVDAAVPVALALVKLGALFAIKYISEMDLRRSLQKRLDIELLLGVNWDIYIMAFLAVVIVTLLIVGQPGFRQARG